MDEYLIPTQFGEAEFVEKKSRFIGRVWPVDTEEEALAKIQEMKKEALRRHPQLLGVHHQRRRGALLR